MSTEKSLTKSYAKYIFSLVLLGSNGVVASYIALNSYEIVFLRTIIGGAFLLLLFKVMMRGEFQALKDKKQFFYIVLSGVLMAASWLFLYEGYQTIGVGLATVIFFTGPAIVMALSPLFFGEKLTVIKVLGIIAAILGMICVNAESFSGSGLSFGMTGCIFAAFLYAFMVIFNKKADKVVGLENSVWQLCSGMVIVAIFLSFKGNLFFSIPSGSIFPILLLGIVNSGIGLYFYFSSFDELPAQSVAVCGYLEPFSALVFSALLLHEQLSALQILGAALILGGALFGETFGMFLDARKEKKTRTPKSKSEPE